MFNNSLLLKFESSGRKCLIIYQSAMSILEYDIRGWYGFLGDWRITRGWKSKESDIDVKMRGIVEGDCRGLTESGKREEEGALSGGSIESAGEMHHHVHNMGFAVLVLPLPLSLQIYLQFIYLYIHCITWTCATSQYQRRRAKETRVGLGQVYPSSTLCHPRNPREFATKLHFSYREFH